MTCPVLKCNVNSAISTQGKFWEEKHVERTVKYEIPIKKCTAVPKRRADIVTSAPHTYMGIHLVPTTATTAPTSSPPVCAVSTSRPDNSTPMDTDEHNRNDGGVTFTSRLSVEEYRARALTHTAIDMQSMADDSLRNMIPNTSTFINNIMLPTLPLFTKTQNQETQTSNMDVKDLYFPPIPNNISELEEYLRNLCNTMDHVGRLRESAKLQLTKLRTTEPSLEIERQKRRRVEVENWKLKREISELKWRQDTFGIADMC